MTEDSRPPSRRLRTFLLASLILNVFLLAVGAGYLLHGNTHHRHAGAPLARALVNAGASLSGPDAAEFNEIVRRDAPRYAAAARKLAAAREELRRQIAADPFNPEAARQAYAAWQECLNGFVDDVGDTLIDALGKISPAGRQKILDERRTRIPDPS